MANETLAHMFWDRVELSGARPGQMGRRSYPVTLLTLNVAETAKLARERGLLLTDRVALTYHPAVIERVGRLVPGARRCPPCDFTESGGELTPTQKVKRKVVADRVADVLESLYR
jgi:long-subunit acyl-CoA synthetase (AMP-forming)